MLKGIGKLLKAGVEVLSAIAPYHVLIQKLFVCFVSFVVKQFTWPVVNTPHPGRF